MSIDVRTANESRSECLTENGRHPLQDAVNAGAWLMPTREEKFAKALELHGDHVIRFLGDHLPWDRIGRVAVETFKCDTATYFIGGDVGAIKIGITNRPLVRLAQFQIGSPIPLRIMALAKGGRDLEREYHKRFAAHRLHGEWFARVPEIEAEIARLQSQEVM